MKKPHLVITQEVNGVPVHSWCPDIQTVQTGSAIGIAEERHSKLDSLSREHFRKVHLREDASQAATRIVREATERD